MKAPIAKRRRASQSESLSHRLNVPYSFQMPELPTAYPLRDLFDAATRGRNVKLTCTACGHVAILSGAGLWCLFSRRGWLDDFKDVQRRSFCMVCWCRAQRKIRNPGLALVEEPPTDTRLPMPSEIEWKREMRRRR